jgi:hypothetical protein
MENFAGITQNTINKFATTMALESTGHRKHRYRAELFDGTFDNYYDLNAEDGLGQGTLDSELLEARAYARLLNSEARLDTIGEYRSKESRTLTSEIIQLPEPIAAPLYAAVGSVLSHATNF